MKLRDTTMEGIEREGQQIELGIEGSNRMSNGVEIILKTIGPSPSSRLLVPSSIKVHDLRNLIAENQNSRIENLKLIWQGKVLHDNKNGDDVHIQLNNGDSLIVAAAPKPPPKYLREDFYDEEEDELRFRLPQSTSRWKRKLFSVLRDKLKLPDFLLMAMFSLSLKMWIVIMLWFVLAPVARSWEVGPLYDLQLSSITLENGSLVMSVHILYSMKISENSLAHLMQNVSTETFELANFETLS